MGLDLGQTYSGRAAKEKKRGDIPPIPPRQRYFILWQVNAICVSNDQVPALLIGSHSHV